MQHHRRRSAVASSCRVRTSAESSHADPAISEQMPEFDTRSLSLFADDSTQTGLRVGIVDLKHPLQNRCHESGVGVLNAIGQDEFGNVAQLAMILENERVVQ